MFYTGRCNRIGIDFVLYMEQVSLQLLGGEKRCTWIQWERSVVGYIGEQW